MSSPISGFTAIPNPQMLAFMPIQSYLMMYFAGAGWQIGKRKISAIPNDQFNKMSANDLLQGFTADLRGSIPTLERSLQDITPLISVLIEQYGDFVRQALAAVPQAISNIFSGGVDTQGGREVIQKGPTAGLSKGTQLGFLGFAEQQLLQQYILDQQVRAGSEQNIKTPAEQFELDRLDKLRIEQLRQDSRDVATRAAMKAAAKRVTAQDTIKPQVRPGLKKRKAGQSQKLERTILIKSISDLGKIIRDAGPGGQNVGHFNKRLRNMQQRLVNLLARYSF